MISKLSIVGIVVAIIFVFGVSVGIGIYALRSSVRLGLGNCFQHNNNVKLCDESYTYVYRYKKELLAQLTKLLDSLKVRFTIAHGNLIEFVRKSPIYHDDDLDLRFNHADMDKWIAWCNKRNDGLVTEYNLAFDGRLKSRKAQEKNGI